jgi:nucleotide-binding universal stress UspA family protein
VQSKFVTQLNTIAMKRKILVPTDFSETSINAFKFAIKMFEKEPCNFYLLNAFSVKNFTLDNLMVPEPGEKNYDHAATKSKFSLDKILKDLDSNYKFENHAYHTISKFTTPLEAIKFVIEEMDIEIVIMGTNGANETKDRIYGSNTVITMEKITNCPVLAIPLHSKSPPNKEIVFVTDFKIPYKKSELHYLTDIIHKRNISLRILHVNNDIPLNKKQQHNKERLPEYLEGIDYSFHTVKGKDIAEAVHLFVEKRNSDLIVFINRKDSLLKRIFSFSMAKELGAYTNIPVMALHD